MERNWTYRDEVGSEYGPYAREELERYAREGRISAQGQIQDPDGNWLPATNAGLEFPEVTGESAPIGATPALSSSEAIQASQAVVQKSPHPRIAYILLGVLLPFCPGLAGINNLMVGRTGPGIAQLVVSVASMFLNVLGMLTGILLCISLPMYLGVLLWSVIEAATNEIDGQGRMMR